MIRPRVELLINLRHIINPNTMGHHSQGIGLALADHLQKRFPVQMDGGLTISDEADTALHKRANVEVIGLRRRLESNNPDMANTETYKADVYSGDATATKVLHRCNHLVHNFRSIGFNAK